LCRRRHNHDLRHSFTSLLLHEGRSVIYVVRQLGHDSRLTLTPYGHVIDELEDSPRIEAEAAIAKARLAARASAPGSVREFGT
jgi:integrase